MTPNSTLGRLFVEQLAIGTEDVYKTAGACELGGGKTVRAAGPLPKIGTKIYGVIDPDGWKTVHFSFPSLLVQDFFRKKLHKMNTIKMEIRVELEGQ